MEREHQLAIERLPAMLRPMLNLQTVRVPPRYTMQFCRPCVEKLFGSLLENLKASCLEQLLEELQQRRRTLQAQEE